MICVSVLTTYQHHFIDVPAGALLGLLCVWLWPIANRVSVAASWRISADPRRRKLALLYGLGSIGLLVVALALGSSLGTLGATWVLLLLWSFVSLLVVSLNYLGFGERGFALDKEGNMHWSARWLLAPYLIGARINVWFWTKSLPASVEIDSGTRLGRQPSMEEWIRADRPLVLSLCAEMPVTRGIQASCVPALDLIDLSDMQLRRALVILDNAKRQKKAVWICCALGFSRSAAVAILHHAISHEVSIQQAYEHVKNAKPQLVVRPAALERLHALLALLVIAKHQGGRCESDFAREVYC